MDVAQKENLRLIINIFEVAELYFSLPHSNVDVERL